MRKILCLLFLSSILCSVHAKKVLDGMNFNSGKWVVIGIPLHNYQYLPVQKEMGTFIIKDVKMMKSIQQNWDLDMTFEDKCDYHYALKFYKDGKLNRTVKLNLYCGYLTWDGLSYDFSPEKFEEIKTSSGNIDWSRISFSDQHLLRKAILTLDKTDDVFWYEDVYEYVYPGYFLYGINRLPWNADLDSLDLAVRSNLISEANSEDFYLKQHFHMIRGDYLNVRYKVNCNENFSQKIGPENQMMPWRSHLQGTDSVRVVAIGINQEKYRKLMKKSRN